MPSKKWVLVCLGILASSFFFFGCGGSSPAITISIAGTGGLTVVDGTDTLTLTATVSNDSNSQGVTWSLSGVGTISGQTTTSVVYTAPAIPGTAQTVTVTATSVADTGKIGTFTITIPAQLAITTTNSTACLTGAVGTAFSCQLTATQGEGTLKWTVDSSTPLPTNWTLSTSGLLTGPPPAAGYTGGTYKFNLTDSGTPTPMTASVTLTITIAGAGPIVFSTTTVPPATGTYNTPYTGTVLATGGAGALTYTLQSGALPTGLNAITSGGLISGTPTAAGTFNFTIKAADSFGDSNTQAYQVVISKATPVLSFASIPTHTFGDADFTVSASSASPGAVSYALTAGQTSSGTVSPIGLVHITGAGTIYLTATQVATADYSGATQNVSFTVNKAAATVHVTPYSVTYDAAAHTATATATGVGGATLNASDLTLTGTTHTNAGTYASDPWSFADPNYVSQSGTVSDSIAKATATVHVTPYSVTYDAAAHTATATATGVGGATLSASDLTLTGTTHTTAGTYASDAWSFADPNYVSQSGTVSDSIAKATATVTVTPYNVTYDGNAHTATASATGVGGAVLSASDFTLTGTAHTNAGTYASDAWSFADPNYVSQSGTVSDSIAKATATVVVTPYNVPYDGNTHTATATATGVGGATLNASDVTLTGTAHSAVGTYTSDPWSFADPNYVSQNGTVSDTITKATATITVTPYSVTYNGNQHTATASATGVGGLTLSVTDFTLTGTQHTNAGAYASDAWSFSDPSGNYSNASGMVSDTILKATATINVTPYNVTYDGNPHTATGTATGVSGANLNADLTLTGTTHTAAGTYASDPWTFSDPSGNYSNVSGTVSDTIGTEVPTLTFNAIPTHYVGDAAFQATATDSSGPVSAGAITYSLTAGQSSAGTVTSGGLVTITGSGTIYLTATQAASGNYAQTTATTTVTVDAALSITNGTTLPTGVVGNSYTQTLTASGGDGNYTWSLISGSTALSGVGLTFTPGTPGVGGTATVAGTTPIAGGPASFTVQVSDTAGHSKQVAFSVTVTANITITTTTLSPNYVYTGNSYTATINALGGTGPYTWTISAGGTALANDHLSLSSGTGLSNTISGTVLSGDPTGPINFTVKVMDHNSVSTMQSYTLNVYGALSLTNPSSTVPGPAVLGSSYTGSNITASGGSGNYSWSITGLSGTSLTYNSTGNPLVISGTAPSTSETLHPEVTLTDTTTSQTYGPIQYSIVVAPATPLMLPTANPNSLPSGTISQGYSGAINATGGSGSGYVWKINGSAVPTDGTTPLTLTDGLNAYSTGGTTLTITGNLGGTAQTVSLTNVTLTDSASDSAGPVTYTISVVNPAAGYNVSGTVSYTGSLTGWIYLQLTPTSCSGNCGGGNLGTAISAKGTYTIHGVPPGTYTLQAWMDNTSTDPTSHEVMGGYGGRNAFNPTGTGGSNVVVSTGAVSGANVTLLAPSPTPNLGSNTPTWDPSHGFGVFSGGAAVSFDPIINGPGVETPNSYLVEWSLNNSFSPVAGSQCFPATADQNPWIISGISGTGPYYFRAAGVIGSCASGTVGDFSAASPSAYTIANPSTGNLVQGTVSFSQTATGPLYVGFYDANTGNMYVDAIGSKASPPTSGVSYSVYVPTGSNYFNFGIVDQKNDGLLAPGDISNTNNQQMQEISISTGENLGNLALPSANSLATVKSQAGKQTDISGNTNSGYDLSLRVVGLYKQPASVELVSGPSYLNPPAFDIATGEFNGNYDEWDASPGTNGSTPSTSDVFTFNVTYTDGTSNSTLNSTPNPLTASPTAILSAFPTLTYPVWNSSSVSTTPTFTWTYPSNPSNYTYTFQLQDSNGITIWQIPGQHSNGNGFSYSQDTAGSITWDVDPTGGGNLPSVSSLNSGSQYTWQIQVSDANGNEASTQMAFQTPTAALSLPSSSTGNALQNSPFSESLNAQGGSGSGYVFSVAVGAGSYQTVGSSATLLTDGISVSSSGNTLTFSGTPSTVENITLNVKVTDSSSDNAGPTSYYIDVVSAPSGVNNGNLSGTYACKVTGYFDADGSSWTTLNNIYFNGSGTISSGVFNSNSKDYSNVSTGGVYGTMSGTYAVGSDNNGVASITGNITSSGGGTFTHTWAIALNNTGTSGTVATEFHMVETDDLGSSPSGQHGVADCYLTTTSAFANSTISGKSFAFGAQGQNGSGAYKAEAGQFAASTGSSGGTVTSGYLDFVKLGQSGDQGGALSSTYSTYTAPDANGRYTLSIAPSGATDTSQNETFTVYIINTGKMFMLETAGDGSPVAGDMRKQQQSADTAAVLMNGSAVNYSQGFEYNGSTISGYDSSILQISSSSTGTYTGTFNVNASFDDGDGTYQVNKEAGASVNVTLDSSNPGRASFTVGDTIYLYFYNANNAFWLDLGSGGDNVATGLLIPQSGTFTNAGIAGTYMLADLPQLSATEDSSVGEAVVASNGDITAHLSNAGINEFSWDQTQSGITYSWASATYGTYTLSGAGGSGNSCMVISATTSVCIDNTSSTGDMTLLQQ